MNGWTNAETYFVGVAIINDESALGYAQEVADYRDFSGEMIEYIRYHLPDVYQDVTDDEWELVDWEDIRDSL